MSQNKFTLSHTENFPMPCCTNNGFLLPGTQIRFFSTQSDPLLRFKPSWIPITSFKIKAKINDSLVKESSELSFYHLLGIPKSGTLPEIKQAYKQLARKYHPDVSPPDQIEEYTKRFIRIQEAYETLSDPRRRAVYDQDMSKSLRLAFSARRLHQNDMEMEDRSEWKNLWQSQLSELKRRSMNKDARKNK